MPIVTERQLLEAHRANLDAKYSEKYPNGKFGIQRFHGFTLSWEPKRPTSHSRFRGISVSLKDNGELKHANFRNNSFGKCTSYNSLEKMLQGCARLNVPNILTEAFVTRCKTWQAEDKY